MARRAEEQNERWRRSGDASFFIALIQAHAHGYPFLKRLMKEDPNEGLARVALHSGANIAHHSGSLFLNL